MPSSIVDAPAMEPGNELFWRAFWELSTCRAEMQMPIPWTAVHVWATAAGLDNEDSDTLHEVVRLLDAEFLAYIAERHKKGASDGKGTDQHREHVPSPDGAHSGGPRRERKQRG